MVQKRQMCRFANKLKQTIVIGGDFNLPVLDWKEEVENEFPNQVFVALYLGTPRHWACDKLIDTFAIVQPSESVHRTEAIFEETMAIYPFPLSCNTSFIMSIIIIILIMHCVFLVIRNIYLFPVSCINYV